MYMSDVGTLINVAVGTSILGATATAIQVKKPDGTTATWTGTVGNDNASINYVTQPGDISLAGTYKLQAQVTIGSSVFYGTTTTLSVTTQFN